jgi:hypothetical protein
MSEGIECGSVKVECSVTVAVKMEVLWLGATPPHFACKLAPLVATAPLL